MMLYWEISYFTLFLYFSFSSPPRAVGVSLLEIVHIRGVPRLSAVMILDLAPNTHNGIFYVCRNSSISNVTLNVKMSIDKGTIVLSVFIIIIVQWSEISYKFHIVQRMYIVLYVRTESLNHFSCISNIFHWMSFTFMVPNVQNVQENLNLWQTNVETNGTFTIYFSELCALVSCVQANNCQALYFNSLFGSLWFLFCWTKSWKQFPSPLVHLSVELEFKRSLKLKGSKTLDCSSSNVEREIV